MPKIPGTESGALVRSSVLHARGWIDTLGRSTYRCMSHHAVARPRPEPAAKRIAIVTAPAPATAAPMPMSAVATRLTIRVYATYCWRSLPLKTA